MTGREALVLAPYVRVVGLVLSALLSVMVLVSVREDASLPPAAGSAAFGVYAGPAAKGVAGAAAWAAFTGTIPRHVLDFAASDNWWNISGQAWMLAPHAGSTAQLEYSLPMVSDARKDTPRACALGAYDRWWRRLGVNLVSFHLSHTVVRPGWEFNGSTYRWRAVGRPAQYAACFRRIVTAMRGVPGGAFTFDWSLVAGPTAMAAETAYPGDAYVDYVGLDVYDMGYDVVRQSRGLTFWAGFAARHHKPLVISEWGVTWRRDGRGGGDDPAFVDVMFDFVLNPDNHVMFAHYFNSASPVEDHVLSTPHTRFPRSAAEYRRRTAQLAGNG